MQNYPVPYASYQQENWTHFLKFSFATDRTAENFFLND
jgi:hypothetical protein